MEVLDIMKRAFHLQHVMPAILRAETKIKFYIKIHWLDNVNKYSVMDFTFFYDFLDGYLYPL